MDVDRIIGRMRRLTRDPDRWVDSDHQRDAWLALVAKQYLPGAAIITLLIIVMGVSCRG